MLTQEPFQPQSPSIRRPRSSGMTWFLVLVVLIVLALRHDYWWWDKPGYLLFGFLPAGLWWQALVSLLASGMMWLLVRYAWPYELEEQADAAERQRHTTANAPADPHGNGKP